MRCFSRPTICVALLAIAFQANVADAATFRFQRTRLFSFLSADQEVQDPVPDVDSFGFGSAKILVGKKRASINVDLLVFLESQTDITRVHIHRGVVGQNGGIEVNFFDTVAVGDREPDPKPIPAPFGIQRLRFRLSVDPELAREIAANPEEFYFNVHTEAFPAGEVRGQLLGF